LLTQSLFSTILRIFNTDQEVQFTARAPPSRLEEVGVAVRRDGRGRTWDQGVVERLWRSVNYEAISIRTISMFRNWGSGLTASFGFDDEARPLRLWVTGPLARSLGPGLAED
jgi:transposase InsO family protein